MPEATATQTQFAADFAGALARRIVRTACRHGWFLDIECIQNRRDGALIIRKTMVGTVTVFVNRTYVEQWEWAYIADNGDAVKMHRTGRLATDQLLEMLANN